MSDKIFRASYSVISKWASGDYKGAIQTYFKLQQFTTVQMEEGKEWHEEWKNESMKTGCLPAIFGGTKLNNPQLEIKIERRIKAGDFEFDLVGVLDNLEDYFLTDYKTGVKPASDYTNEHQLGIYGYLALLTGRNPQMGRIMHYNQYTKEVDVAFAHLTDNRIKLAVSWVIFHAQQMYAYMIENDVFSKVQNYLDEKELSND